MKRHTKIIATMGPAVASPEMMRELIRHGLDVARLNFSHDVHEAHAQRINWLREAAKAEGVPIAILQDLQGPKIRTGKLANGESVTLVAGKPFVLTVRDIDGDENCVSTTYKNIIEDVKPGHPIMISDGNIELRVLAVEGTEIKTEIIHGGELAQYQGINLPGTNISLPCLTEKDLIDFEFGLKMNVDYVALSFVRSAADILQAKAIIERHDARTKVIAKIERPEALDCLDEILEVADGVLVARGDMGVEVDAERVPMIQKEIIRRANHKAVPVITATHMLDSMIYNPRPTRAEISDVANAILDGSDAVMLSGETSKGKYPLQAVDMMVKIAQNVERTNPNLGLVDRNLWQSDTVPQAIAHAILNITQTFPVKAIWALTLSGASARWIAQFRPNIPIYAFTPNDKVFNQLRLVWGVTPVKTEFFNSTSEFERQIQDRLHEFGVENENDMIIIAGGHPTSECSQTNFIKIDQPKRNLNK